MLRTGVASGGGGRRDAADCGGTVGRVQVVGSDGSPIASFGTFGTGRRELSRPMNLAVDEAATFDLRSALTQRRGPVNWVFDHGLQGKSRDGELATPRG